MRKKQNLRNAVILGLLMSSVTAGSAWAKDLNVENIKQTHEKLQSNFGNITITVGIAGNKYFNKFSGIAQGFQEFEDYNTSQDFRYDEINITAKNNYYYKLLHDPENIKGAIAVGIMSTNDENVDLKSLNDVNVNVWTRNSRDAYGIASDNSGRSVDIFSENGTISVNVEKTNGKKI